MFDTRPEYGEDRDGFPGGHLCYYDPKTGFSRSLGIPVKQEGLMAGAIDDARGRLYYRSEPKNHFLVYDLKANRWRDRGHVGAMGRYMAMGQDGAVYTVGRDGYLCRYDPATITSRTCGSRSGRGRLRPALRDRDGPNGKLYGLVGGHGSVMEFDTDRSGRVITTVTMRNVAPAAPAGLSADDIHAGVFGQDGRLYFPVNTTDRDARAAARAHALRPEGREVGGGRVPGCPT